MGHTIFSIKPLMFKREVRQPHVKLKKYLKAEERGAGCRTQTTTVTEALADGDRPTTFNPKAWYYKQIDPVYLGILVSLGLMLGIILKTIPLE